MQNPELLAFSVAILVTLGGFSGSLRAQDEPTAEAILDACDRAAGSDEARKNFRSLVLEGAVAAKGSPMKASFTEVHLGDDRVMQRTVFEGMGETVIGTDGKITWSVDAMMGTEVRQGDNQGGMRRTLLLGHRAAWRTLYVAAKLDGEARVGERPVWRLALKGRDGTRDTWYVDRENHDLLGLDTMLPNFVGGEMPCRWRFSKFKAVEGLRIAHRRVQIVGPNEKSSKPDASEKAASPYEIHYTIESAAANVPIAPKRVAPPAAALKRLAEGEAHPDRATPAGVVRIHEIAKQKAALSKPTTCAPMAISRTLGKLLPKVAGHLAKSGTPAAGPPLTVYETMSPEKVTLRAGMPVARDTKADDQITNEWLAGGKVAITWHWGSYEGLSETHQVLETWMKGAGWEPAGPVREVYWTDPGLEPDLAKWRTQIICPVRPLRKR